MKIANKLCIDHCLKEDKKNASRKKAKEGSPNLKSRQVQSRRHKSTGRAVRKAGPNDLSVFEC